MCCAVLGVRIRVKRNRWLAAIRRPPARSLASHAAAVAATFDREAALLLLCVHLSEAFEMQAHLLLRPVIFTRLFEGVRRPTWVPATTRNYGITRRALRNGITRALVNRSAKGDRTST